MVLFSSCEIVNFKKNLPGLQFIYSGSNEPCLALPFKWPMAGQYLKEGFMRTLHCKDKMPNLKQIFPEKEYRGLSSNFHIHVSVSELYIPAMGLPFLLEEIC
jgi:hypothetical protein